MTVATQLRLLGYYCKLAGLLGADRPGEVAFSRFRLAPPRNITPKQATFLDTARRTDVDFEGHRIAAYEWGDPTAPYVYTAYGWGYNAGRWRHFAPALLEAGYRVCAFDYLGHGHSSGRGILYPKLVRLHRHMMDYWGAPELMLCHSFGAGTAVSALLGEPPGRWPARYALLAPFSDLEYLFRQYARALGFSESQYASLDRAVQRHAGAPVASFDVAAQSGALADLPALIAHDPGDAVTAISNAKRLHAHWPGSLLYAAHGAGHGFADAEATETVIAWLLAGERPPGALGDASRGRRRPSREAHGSATSAYFEVGPSDLR